MTTHLCFRVLLWSLLAAAPAAAQDPDPQWLLVRGETASYANLSMERIAEAYLGRFRWRMVRAGDAASVPSASRLVIGTPEHNDAVPGLLQALGIERGQDRLSYRGHVVGPGMGLVVVTADPDGEGELVLFTGTEPKGVAACLSVSVDLGRRGFTIARWQKVVHREWGDPAPARKRLDTSRPQIVRLDRDYDHLRASVTDAAPTDVALRLARGLAGYRFVYEAAFGRGVEMLSLMGQVAGEMQPVIDGARKRFESIDLDAEIRRLHDLCVAKLGPRVGPCPVYYVLYGHPNGTNAKNFDHDEVTGRRRVLINLCRMADRAELEVAVIHETVHTLQESFGRRLVDRAVIEGVATHLTQLLRPETGDALALMWSNADLAAASERRAPLVAAFRRAAESREPEVLAEFLRADRRPSAVSGAPSRSGYYVGWLAAAAWCAAHPEAPPSDLLKADATEVLETLR